MTEPDVAEVGPIDYLVIEFPADRIPDGSALPLLDDLVTRGIIKLLDLVFVRKELDGSIFAVAIEDFDLTGDFDVSLFAGAASGLIVREDLDEAASALEPGCSGAILIYENHWAAPFASALRRNGAQLVASGRVSTEDLLDSLDALGV